MRRARYEFLFHEFPGLALGLPRKQFSINSLQARAMWNAHIYNLQTENATTAPCQNGDSFGLVEGFDVFHKLFTPGMLLAAGAVGV